MPLLAPLTHLADAIRETKIRSGAMHDNRGRRKRPRIVLPAHPKLRVWRTKSGFTLRELARVLECAYTTTRAWFYAGKRPSPKMRLVLEKITQGAVCVEDWLTVTERAAWEQKREKLARLADVARTTKRRAPPGKKIKPKFVEKWRARAAKDQKAVRAKAARDAAPAQESPW